jgi:hypothetical protein
MIRFSASGGRTVTTSRGWTSRRNPVATAYVLRHPRVTWGEIESPRERGSGPNRQPNRLPMFSHGQGVL